MIFPQTVILKTECLHPISSALIKFTYGDCLQFAQCIFFSECCSNRSVSMACMSFCDTSSLFLGQIPMDSLTNCYSEIDTIMACLLGKISATRSIYYIENIKPPGLAQFCPQEDYFTLGQQNTHILRRPNPGFQCLDFKT